MRIESTKSVLQPETNATFIDQTKTNRLHHSTLDSLSIHQKQVSTVFTCIKRFFELFFQSFIRLFHLLLPSLTSKESQEPTVFVTLDQSAPQNPSPIVTPEEPASIKPLEQAPSEKPQEVRIFQIMAAAKGKSSFFSECTFAGTIVSEDFPPHLKDNALMRKQYLDQSISFYKYVLCKTPVHAHNLFKMNPEAIYICENENMPYGYASDGEQHWFANFTDSSVMASYAGPLLTQTEEQVLIHPALYHVKTTLWEQGHQHIRPNEVFLLRHVPCNSIDTNTNEFAPAPPQARENTYPETPMTTSNIFFLATPFIEDHLAGKPYEFDDLRQLFYTAFTAFISLKNLANADKIHVHTGNWGTETHGHSTKTTHLIQLAAARAADITLHVHPLDKKEDFFAAEALLKKIECEEPKISIYMFLVHLAKNTDKYGLIYPEAT